MVLYRIPHKYIDLHFPEKTLGLGVIIHAIEISCDGEFKNPILLGQLSSGARMKSYYDTYHTVSMSALNCKGDVLIKNWFKPSYKRYGYSNSPATIGEASWIARVKDLVEFFQGEVLVIIAALFLMLYLVIRSLRRLSYVSLTSTPFEIWSPYWLFYTLVFSDVVVDLFFPFTFGFWMWIIPRSGYFFGIVTIFGSMLTSFSGSMILPSRVRYWSALLIRPQKRFLGFSILVILSLILNISPLFSIGYRSALVIGGLSSFIVALAEKNILMVLFGVAALSDYCKTMMIPYLPTPRLTSVYVGIVLVYSMVKQIRFLEKTAKEEGKSDLAMQVAHDIRSPLNSLSLLVPALSEVSEEKRRMVGGAIDQIYEIANELVVSHKRSMKEYEFFQECLILNVIDQVIREKSIQIKQKSLLKIVKEIDPEAFCVFCKLSPVQFIRVLSNLIDNSIEAIGNKSGEVKIHLSANEENVFLKISDNGAGIPESILRKLGEKGITSGKLELKSGSGLGVYHAKKVIKEWGGRLIIETEIGKGTHITLHLPRAKPPVWFIPKLVIPMNSRVVVLDDDLSIHEIWSRRLREVGFDTEKILHYFRANQMEEEFDFPVFYLVDYLLMGSSQNGLEFIRARHISASSVLVTHSFDEIDVSEGCERMDLKMLPKILAESVPIVLA
jgi:signal transduction histidine kinase